MATGTLSAPTVLSNGYQCEFTVTGGTWGGTLATSTETAIAFTVVSEGYDATGSLTTHTRMVYGLKSPIPTFSGGKITVTLSDPIFVDDNTGAGKSGTAPTVVCAAGAIADGTDTTAALTSTAVTNNSTLKYPKVIGRFAFINGNYPHKRQTGTWSEYAVGGSWSGAPACAKMSISAVSRIPYDGGSGTLIFGAVLKLGSVYGYLAAGSSLSGATGTLNINLVKGTTLPADNDAIVAPLIVAFDGGSSGGYLMVGETVSWNGTATGTGEVAPGSTLEWHPGTPTGTVYIYLASGAAPADNDVITGANGTVTTNGAPATPFTGLVNGTPSGGQVKTVTATSFTAVSREGSYGPATSTMLYKFDFDADDCDGAGTDFASGPARRRLVIYPIDGDASSVMDSDEWWTSTSGQTKIGENELFLDPTDADAANIDTYYIDSTLSASHTGITGTFTDFEFAKIVSGGSTVGVVRIVGAQSGGAGSLRFAIDEVTAADAKTSGSISLQYWGVTSTVGGSRTIPVTLSGSGSPVYGDYVRNTGDTAGGIVLAYSGGVLTYVATHGALANTNVLEFFASSYNESTTSGTQALRGYGATCTAGPTVLTTIQPASGDTITGFSSGATCTLDGAPSFNGDDANAGTSVAPFHTILQAMRAARTTRSSPIADVAAGSYADGTIVYCKAGMYSQGPYNSGATVEVRHHPPIVSPAPGVSKTSVRIARSKSDGNRNNFLNLQGITIEQLGTTAVANTNTLANSNGNYDRRWLVIRDCVLTGVHRTHPNNWFGGVGTSWEGVVINNSLIESCSNSNARYHGDNFIRLIGEDAFSSAWCVVNCETKRTNAANSSAHADIWQVTSGSTGNNLVGWGIKATERPAGQGLIFVNNGSGYLYQNFLFVNVLQDANNSASFCQITGDGAGIHRNYVFWHYTNGDKLAVSGTSTKDRLFFRNCYFGDATGHTTASLFFSKCHWTEISGAAATLSYGVGGTYAGSESDIFVYSDISTDYDQAGYMVPKASSTLLNRVAPASQIIGRDVYGRLLSQDATALAAIGGAQPIPVLTVTYDGASVSDGGTVTETAGTKSLVMSSTTGPTGSVVYVSSVALGGTVTGTDASPYTLTSGGTTQSGTISTSLTAGAATVDITYDLGSLFDFDITGQSAGGGFRSRSRSRKR